MACLAVTSNLVLDIVGVISCAEGREKAVKVQGVSQMSLGYVLPHLPRERVGWALTGPHSIMQASSFPKLLVE